MVKEANERSFERERIKTIPVGILMRDGLIFTIRDKAPGKYIQNPWRPLVGRQWRGEEKPEDLINLARECGFTIRVKDEIGQVDNGIDYTSLLGGSMVFNLYVCEVIGGSFDPAVLYPRDEFSYYNQLANCEGEWFSIQDLEKQNPIHHLFKQALRFLKEKNYESGN